MSINSINRLRFAGLATGIDTDSMVNQLMRVERMKVDRIKQDRQLAEWRRDSYRDVTRRLMDFKRDYFDVVRRDNYMLTPANYRSFDLNVSNEAALRATASPEAQVGSITINKIDNLATAATISTGVNQRLSHPISGTPVFEGDPKVLDLSGKSFSLQLDGVSRTISFGDDAVFGSRGDLKDALNARFEGAFGAGRVEASLLNDDGIKLVAEGSTLRVGSGDALQSLGLTAGSFDRVTLGAALNLGELEFSINGVDFYFNNSSSLQHVINSVNNSNAGVTLSYSNITDRLTLASKTTGAGEAINIVNTSGAFFGESSFSGINAGVVNNGQDAFATINGVDVRRSQNTFDVDGVRITLQEETNVATTIEVGRNNDRAFDMIVKFVSDYNQMLGFLNEQLTEPEFRDFRPLTGDQRETLSEKDIEQWEDKAKSGLLRNDPLLQRLVTSMRSSLSSAVEGAGISLFNIGITTGSYHERGQLRIDENRLRQALQERPDEVIQLFANTSDIAYSPNLTAEQRTTRFGQIGLARRLSDIVEDNVRTIRDNNGRKGILLERAGITGDASDTSNSIHEQLRRFDQRIDNAMELLGRREEQYWKRFTAMEKAISQLNSQGDWLSQQMTAWNK